MGFLLHSVAILLGLQAFAAPTPADFAAQCAADKHPLRAPRVVFKAHGLDIDNACPFQTQVDTRHECQDSASVLQNMFDELVKQKTKACAAAQAAAAKASQDCQNQASCMDAQRAALATFQNELKTEIDMLKDYADQADFSMKYAVKNIAGGGVWLLHGLKSDESKEDDGTHKFGPDGRGGAADFVQAASNQDAVNRVFRGESEAKADAVVKKFLNDQGTASDISGLKSSLIREPLSVAQAGEEWKRELVAYQKDLETKSSAIRLQSATLGKRGTSLNTLTPAPAASPSSLSGTPAPIPAASQLGNGINGVSNAAGAAGALAPMLNPGSSGASGSGSSDSGPLGFGGAMGRKPGNDKTPNSATADGTAPVPGAAPGTDASTTAALDSTPAMSGKPVKIARTNAHSSGSSTGARVPASSGPAPAKGKVTEGNGVAGGADSTDPAMVSTPAPAPGSAPFGGATDSGSLSSFSSSGAPGAPAAAESNEKAVQNIVGDWEKALNPEAQPPAEGANAILGGETPSLFSRIRVAHERALQRGSLTKVPGRL